MNNAGRGVFSTSQLSGCVQLFGPPAEARLFEYRMELDDRPGRQRHHACVHGGHRENHRGAHQRDAMRRIADIQERISYFQVCSATQMCSTPRAFQTQFSWRLWWPGAAT